MRKKPLTIAAKNKFLDQNIPPNSNQYAMVAYLQLRKWIYATFLTFLLAGISFYAQAQTQLVSGTIKDAEGNLMPGVSVLEKGTTNGTSTDASGQFSITVNPGTTLVFSFIGMKPQEIIVNTQTSINVVLQTDVSELDEVVVIGYGTVKKSDLTGSVVSVTGDDLKKMPVASVSETMTGRMAGVQVSSTEGSPDAEIRIRVRGGTSLSQDNSPLYIVDGFPIGSISDISPSDIASITVLKDASSTAIYGSRGANGVVIITTKGGNTDGKVSVSLNTFAGFKKIAKTLDVLEPEDYVRWQYEYAMLRNNNDLSSYEDYFGAYQDMDLYSGLKGNDWQRQVYGRTGHVFSTDLSVRGGTEKFNYSANYARFQEKAIMIGSDFVRNNITVKMNASPNDKIDFGFSLRYSNTEINGGGANEQNEKSSVDSRLKHAVSYAPLPIPGLVANSDDTNEQVAGDLTNPIRATWDNDRYQQRNNYNIGGSFGWQIIDNLKLKVDGGLDSYVTSDYRFYGITTYYSKNNGGSLPAVIMADGRSTRLRNTNTLNYDFKDLLPHDHHLNVLIGQEVLSNKSDRTTSTIHEFDEFYDADAAFKLTAQGKNPVSVDKFYSPNDNLLSFFARASYDFKGKYLLDVVYRADGSSKFLGNNVWGYFPSMSAGWKVTEEDFMKGVSGWLSSLKLRGSYGAVGNNNIPAGQTFQFFLPGSNVNAASLLWMNGTTTYWAASKTMANPDLKWETTYTTNVGLDFGLFSDRVTGTVELYKNHTKDLLVRFPTAGSGYEDQYRNLGETINKGVELSLTYAIIDEKNYGLSISLNTAFNRNKIESLGSLTEITAGTNSNWASTQIGSDFKVMVGQPIGQMWGYKNDGRYEASDFQSYNSTTDRYTLKDGVADASGVVRTTSNARPGMMKLKDISGPEGVPDGIVDAYDKAVIGNANPKHSGGFVLNAYAYGFDLTASFNYSFGNSIYNANKIEYTTSNLNTQYRNLTTEMADGKRWTNINATGQLVTDLNELATLNENTTTWSPYMNQYVFSDWAVEDGSFLRLNTLTLGYTVPADITSKAKIKNLRVYATGYNVFVITNYTGFDPEVSTRRNTPYTPGVDYSAYPRSRQWVIGVNFNF